LLSVFLKDLWAAERVAEEGAVRERGSRVWNPVPMLPAFTKKKALAASFSKHCGERGGEGDGDGDDGVEWGTPNKGANMDLKWTMFFFRHTISRKNLSCLVVLGRDRLPDLELPWRSNCHV
jgi:hypothetical protein